MSRKPNGTTTAVTAGNVPAPVRVRLIPDRGEADSPALWRRSIEVPISPCTILRFYDDL